MKLNDLKAGENGLIVGLSQDDVICKRLLELGFIPNERVTVTKRAPFGDPIQVMIRGSEVILRHSEAECIELGQDVQSDLVCSFNKIPIKKKRVNSHKMKRLALVGNQNCGKTTLFNRLTGAEQHVGNFPGVTVECKSGVLKGHSEAEIIDLPGLYSLNAFGGDERVAADFLMAHDIDCIINIVSAVDLERGLYLTTQLGELEIPVVIAVNMSDELRKCGGKLNVRKLSESLKMPVVGISAAKNENIDELVSTAMKQANAEEFYVLPKFCGEKNFLRQVMERYAFVDSLLQRAYKKGDASKINALSDRADRLLTGKYTAYPTFAAIMGAVFWLTFGSLGKMLQAAMSSCIGKLGIFLGDLLKALNVSYVLQSLIIDGILGGVGSVVSFLPIIMLLFFFLSLLEDSGYMARIAFITDSAMRKFGLSGRSVVPMLIGFGCTVPAVMSGRTISSECERRRAVLLLPFVSCTAKLPIYGLFTSVFFPEMSAVITAFLYLFGIIMGVLTTSLSLKLQKNSEQSAFVMELPSYRMPTLKNTLMLMWSKCKDFLQKAFTVIFLASTAIWLMQHFDLSLRMTENPNGSILSMLSGIITPIFEPLGFGDWRITASLLTGFISKESVAATISILFGGGGITEAITPLSAFCLLVFCLLYTPCIAAIAAVRREFGGFFAVKMIALQCTVAWISAFLIHLIGTLIGL